MITTFIQIPSALTISPALVRPRSSPSITETDACIIVFEAQGPMKTWTDSVRRDSERIGSLRYTDFGYGKKNS